MAGDVFGARAAVALLTSTGHERQQPHALAHPQRADSLRAVKLVRRDRQQVDAERLDVDRHLAGRLHGVGVHQRAMRLARSRRARRSAECVPISLFACITDTIAVSSVIAVAQRLGRDDAARDRPAAASRASRAAPAPSSVFSTASCSMAVAIRCCRPVGLERLGRAADGEVVALGPPAVKTTSDASAPRSAATWPRASSTRGLGLLPEMVDARRVAPELADGAIHAGRPPPARPGSWRYGRDRCAHWAATR